MPYSDRDLLDVADYRTSVGWIGPVQPPLPTVDYTMAWEAAPGVQYQPPSRWRRLQAALTIMSLIMVIVLAAYAVLDLFYLPHTPPAAPAPCAPAADFSHGWS